VKSGSLLLATFSILVTWAVAGRDHFEYQRRRLAKTVQRNLAAKRKVGSELPTFIEVQFLPLEAGPLGDDGGSERRPALIPLASRHPSTRRATSSRNHTTAPRPGQRRRRAGCRSTCRPTA